MKADFVRGDFIAKLKELGADAVRERLSEGYWAWPAEECAKEWLEHEDNKLRLAAEVRAEERNLDALETAKEANRIASEALSIAKEDLSAARLSAASAREQARWAKWAAILAAIAAIIAAKDQILALIFGHP